MGDRPGHEFHGNQFKGGGEGQAGHDYTRGGATTSDKGHAAMRETAAQSHGRAALAHENAASILEKASNGDSHAAAQEFDAARHAHALTEEAHHATSSIAQHPAMAGTRGVLGPNNLAKDSSHAALTGSRGAQHAAHIEAANQHAKALSALRAGPRS